MKRRFLSLTGLLLALCVLTVNVLAAGAVDMDRKGSISVTMSYQGEVVPGGSLTLHHVAEVYGANGGYGFRYVEDYTGCEADLSRPGAEETARELAEYTDAQKLQGVKETIDAQGFVSFKDLKPGLYLLVQEDRAPGYETVSPFLVTVPANEAGAYIYEVDASPKLELEKKPSPPDKPPHEPEIPPDEPETPPDEPAILPDEPEVPEIPPMDPVLMLPQTGMTNWPIPVLASGGVFLIVLGWYLRATGGKRREEN